MRSEAPAGIGEAELQLWHARIGLDSHPGDPEPYRGILDEGELTYARRCLGRRRKEFLVGRAGLRRLLSAYFPAVQPGAWRFVGNRYGRPELDGPVKGGDLRFNVTHSGDRLCFAFFRGDAVGVDIEHTSRKISTMDLARRHFSPAEVTELATHAGADRHARFFHYWTLKEALIKAVGKGLSMPLDLFSFVIEDKKKIRISFDPSLGESPEHWQFTMRSVAGDYQLATAAKLVSGKTVRLVDRGELEPPAPLRKR